MLVHWKNNVSFDPIKMRVVFQNSLKNPNPIVHMLEYLQEVHPNTSFFDLAKMVIPELQAFRKEQKIRFYLL